jgi:hypothetical protein
MRDSHPLLLIAHGEPTPPRGRPPFLCKLGLHRIDAINQHVLYPDGVWYDRTLNRCTRETCPLSLWWVCVDVERAHHQISFEDPPRIV